jgi:hypothetical protein
MNPITALAGLAGLAGAGWLLATARARPDRVERYLDRAPASTARSSPLRRLERAAQLTSRASPAELGERTTDAALIGAVAIACAAFLLHSVLVLLGALLVAPGALLLGALILVKRAERMRGALLATWLEELAAIRHATSRGTSLASALSPRTHGTGAWAEAWGSVLRAVAEGRELAAALKDLARLVERPTVASGLTLLAAAWRLGTIVPTLVHLEEDALRARRFEALRRASVREQLVWIPVAIAALVPGVALIVIPLAASLRAVVGLSKPTHSLASDG